MELTTSIMDLEVTIGYIPHKAERMTWTSPGSPAYVEYEITHICGMSLDKMAEIFGHDSMATLHDWIIERDGKTFEKLAEAACWEDLREHESEMVAYQMEDR